MARHGENIHKRKDGRWEARIIIGHNEHHKAVYRSFYGTTYEEVKTKKEDFLSHGSAKYQIDCTFGQIADEWLASKSGRIKVSSYNHYYNQYHLHIRPYFENRRITELNQDEYSSFLMQKEEEGYSSRTLLLLRTIIKMILHFAENTYKIPIPKDIYMPKTPKKQAEAFTKQEQQ